MRGFAVLVALSAAALSGCHAHGFVFKNETGHPILLTISREGRANSIPLPADGTIVSLPGVRGIDRIEYRYGAEVCAIEGAAVSLQRGKLNEAAELRLPPCNRVNP